MITEETIARVKSSLQTTKSFTALEVIEELEKENEELKAQLERISVTNFNVIEKLKAQIKKMKCCGNCKHCYLWEDFYINMNCSLPNTNIDLGNKCDKWELAERIKKKCLVFI